MKIEWRNYDHMLGLCRANVSRARDLDPEVIVGIPRSGMIPASILATSLGLPLADLHSFCAGRVWNVSDSKRPSRAHGLKRVLLIDDASTYSAAMPRAVHMLRRSAPGIEVLKCAVYVSPEAVGKFHLAMDVCAKPRMFEWNWWRSGRLASCALDIDGVICLDPTRDQKRDPDRYLEFIASAVPLFVPSKPVGALVTGRSAAYRAETEDWMRRHGVSFKALHMFDGPSPRDREKHARSKADFYRASTLDLFFESDDRQAAMIAAMSGRDVVCVTTRTLHTTGAQP